METTVFEIELLDGRIFRVFCANSTQKRKALASFSSIKNKIKDKEVIASGVHTVKQWEQIVETI